MCASNVAKKNINEIFMEERERIDAVIVQNTPVVGFVFL